MTKNTQQQHFTSETLSSYLWLAGVSLTPRTIQKKAATDPASLPFGRKVGGKWLWQEQDVLHWLSVYKRRDTTGVTTDSSAVVFNAQPVPVDSTEAKLGYLRRLRIASVVKLVGLSKSSIWKRVNDGRLPRPHKDGSITYWLAGELLSLLESSSHSHRAQERTGGFKVIGGGALS